jgi:adenine deaminase
MRKLFMSKVLTMLMALALIGAVEAHAQDYDVVLKGGRVMDPETSLDAVMNVGIKDGKIAAVPTSSTQPTCWMRSEKTCQIETRTNTTSHACIG